MVRYTTTITVWSSVESKGAQGILPTACSFRRPGIVQTGG